MDIAGDDTGVWMTYDELAVARDIKRDGARRLSQRHRWRRHPGNDGLARVLVPREWLSNSAKSPRDTPRDTVHDTARDSPGDVSRDNAQPAATVSVAPVTSVAPDVAGVVTALQGAIDTLRQQLIRADAREDALRVALEQARAEAEERTSRAEELVANLEADGRTKDLQLAEAEQAARIATDALNAARRSEEARKGRGALRRAWEGWRGR